MKNLIQQPGKLYRLGKLHGAWSAPDLLARVEALDAWRNSIPDRQRWLRYGILGGIFITVLLWILHSNFPPAQRAGEHPELVYSIVVYTTMLATVALIVFRIRMGGMDRYNGDATAVLRPLVRCIQQDLDPRTPLRVNASLKSSTSPDLQVGVGKTYHTPNYPNCVDTLFKRNVMSLDGRLRDGTRLQVRMTEQTLKATHSKKNRRGKTKTREKYKKRITTRVRLLLDQNRCRLKGGMKLPAGTSVRIRNQPQGIQLFLTLQTRVVASQRLDAQSLLAILVGAYAAITTVNGKRGGKQ